MTIQKQVTDYQEQYNLLKKSKNQLVSAMNTMKKDAANEGITMVNGKFTCDKPVVYVKYKYALVTRYVGEKGTMYSGGAGAFLIFDEDKENFLKLLIFLSKESNRTLEAYNERLEDLNLERYDQIFQHEYGYFFLATFNTVIDFSIKDEDFEGDSSNCTPDEVEDIYFTMDAKGGESGHEGQFHDNSSFELVHGKLSEYEAVKWRDIEDEFDVYL